MTLRTLVQTICHKCPEDTRPPEGPNPVSILRPHLTHWDSKFSTKLINTFTIKCLRRELQPFFSVTVFLNDPVRAIRKMKPIYTSVLIGLNSPSPFPKSVSQSPGNTSFTNTPYRAGGLCQVPQGRINKKEPDFTLINNLLERAGEGMGTLGKKKFPKSCWIK